MNIRALGRGWVCLWLAGLAACNGKAVITLTGTPSTDNFLSYRVALAAVNLSGGDGGSNLQLLPSATTVDFATLGNVNEVLGVASASKGSYSSATVTLDYTAAQIVYDDGTRNGVALTAVDANGQPVTQLTVNLSLDPAAVLKVSTSQTNRLALDFKLGASNVVNAAAKTVTVTPMITATASTNDTKAVRVRGAVVSSSAGSNTYTTTIVPFNGTVKGEGELNITPGASTRYEVNGIATSGSAGINAIAAAGKDALVITYGTLASQTALATAAAETDLSTNQTTDTNLFGTTTTPAQQVTSQPTSLFKSSTTSSVAFNATQVLGGSSVQGFGLDHVSGIVSARLGNVMTIEDGTVLTNDGIETFLPGTITIGLGANTVVTTFGESAGVLGDTIGQISVGTTIDAFGILSDSNGTDATLDATTGRVRIDSTYASGLVTLVQQGALIMKLVSLDNRSLAAFDFTGTGTSSAVDASAAEYTATTTSDVSNLGVGSAVILQGAPAAFTTGPPDFTASTLLDPTTIEAQFVLDWAAGTAAPFSSASGSTLVVDNHNAAIAGRHVIQLGASYTDLTALSTPPSITSNTAGAATTAAVYAIGHAVSKVIENYDSLPTFVSRLQSELNGVVLATNMTAVGQYTAGSSTFAATSITILLNN